MKKLSLAILLSASQALAGSGMSGGTPPAREALLESLMAQPELDGGLFEAGSDLSLLTRTKLQPTMLVRGHGTESGTPSALQLEGGSQGGGTPPALRFSPSDIETLRARTSPIDAIGDEGQNLSYSVLAGDSLDSLTLKDRRQIMRESVKNTK